MHDISSRRDMTAVVSVKSTVVLLCSQLRGHTVYCLIRLYKDPSSADINNARLVASYGICAEQNSYLNSRVFIL
jgi:hypothetical protein